MLYRPIPDYAVIGDAHTAALVSTDGSIDWACLPHFDSPALFLRLLDADRGGFCAIQPRGLNHTSRQYLEATAILETTFATATGVLKVTDFMPLHPPSQVGAWGQDVMSPHGIVRLLRCVEGSVDLDVVVRPTFHFARHAATIIGGQRHAVVFETAGEALQMHSDRALMTHADQASAAFRLESGAGESAFVALAHARPGDPVAPVTRDGVQALLERTREYWEHWSRACAYQGPHRDSVLRSAITLKLLTFEPTGAIIAAPTTSLPEEIGGIRNWDYRYSWLRDASFTLRALMNLGYFGEARDYFYFLCRACECPASEFQILYDIHGGFGPREQILAHLDGYRGSKPVRIGNAAASQQQLDVYGELLDCILLFAGQAETESDREICCRVLWPTIASVADYVVRHWPEPDSGIWEVRGGERHFVHSKAMCWVALDRAVKLAALTRADADVAGWTRERDAILASVLQEGFDARAGAFVQTYGSTALDASILRLPMLGVIDAIDPHMRSTVEQIERRLVRNGLVYRYHGADDGLPGGEATFAVCTFWLVQNYVIQGRLNEAEALFRHVLTFANDVGLFAEEIDPVTGEQLGNFPQGFTHIGLINAAVRLAAAQEGRMAATEAVIERGRHAFGERIP